MIPACLFYVLSIHRSPLFYPWYLGSVWRKQARFSKHWPGFSQFALISPRSTKSVLQSASNSLAFNVHFVRLISLALCTNSGGTSELLWLPPASSEPLSVLLCARAKKCAGIEGGLMGQFLTNPDGCLRRNWSKLTVSDNYRLPRK